MPRYNPLDLDNMLVNLVFFVIGAIFFGILWLIEKAYDWFWLH